MSSFFGAGDDDDLGGGSLWDAVGDGGDGGGGGAGGAGGFGFGASALSRKLAAGGATLEDALAEDDFIQETLGRAPALLALLASPAGALELARYLAVPGDAGAPGGEASSFRFPYMACEALCCDVPPLTDALTGDAARREAARAEGGGARAPHAAL